MALLFLTLALLQDGKVGVRKITVLEGAATLPVAFSPDGTRLLYIVRG